ncbi:hypothetical protein N7486_010674 [Penicillium sp. IBT 16267x]|nr:hypothetical protein N7486_010674 [Penicillium sp. IBT 16267x]
MTDVSHENLPIRGNGGKAKEWGEIKVLKKEWKGKGKKVEIKMAKGKNQGVAQLYTFALSWWLANPAFARGPKAPSVAIGSRGSREGYAAPRLSDDSQLFN